MPHRLFRFFLWARRTPVGVRLNQAFTLLIIFALGYAVGSIVTWAFGVCGFEPRENHSNRVSHFNSHEDAPQADSSHLAGQQDLPVSKKHRQCFLVILILSSPDGFQQRNAVRTTWLKMTEMHNGPTSSNLHLFAIGTADMPPTKLRALAEEHETYRDLLLLPTVKDSYFGLTYKVLAAMEWVAKEIDFRFLLKVDDDSFVQLDLLRSELQKYHDRLYMGFFDGRAKVKKTGKWAEHKWFLCDTYLPHALGGGYVLSADLVQHIATNARLWTLYNSEDVSIGTWLSPLHVKRVHSPQFDTEYLSRGCMNTYIVTHKQTIDQMKEKYYNFKNLKKICTKEYKLRNSYIYNWAVLPSKCCIRNNTNIP